MKLVRNEKAAAGAADVEAMAVTEEEAVAEAAVVAEVVTAVAEVAAAAMAVTGRLATFRLVVHRATTAGAAPSLTIGAGSVTSTFAAQ